MNEKVKFSLRRIIFVSCITLLCIGSIALSATSITWSNGGGDGDWNNTANWTGGVLPNSTSDYARITTTAGPIFSTGRTATAYRVYLEGAGNGTLTVTDGNLVANNHIYIAAVSTDRGTLNISGGVINILGTLYVGRDAGSIGTVNLSGGIINCAVLSMRFSGGTGTINITNNGQLVINGDVSLTIGPYITNGWIKAYGGKGSVQYDYNGNSDKTTIWATISNNSTFPNPINGATDVPFQGLCLGWKPGASAVCHNVYFSTVPNDVDSAQRLTGDIRGDGIIDFLDLSGLLNYWLSSPVGSEPYVGINGDNIVDFDDYALLSQSWKARANSAFRCSQDANTFDQGLLNPQTTYYWRVDEVNGPNTVRGNIWSFTTQSGKAYIPSPADAAPHVNNNLTMSWWAGLGAQSHDVYLGTTNPPTFQTNQTTTTFNPGTLAYNTTYYWRVDEIGVSGTVQGNVWSFTTASVPDSNYSLVGKVMCGYQGWFNTPTDGAGRGWVHWSSSTFSPVSCTVDMWPDMTEMTPGEKYLANGFSDGNDYYVFSSYNHDTVIRHFLWMAQYGIDGIFLQRFGTELFPGSLPLAHRNAVLAHCKEGANLYTRKYAVMYDLSWLPGTTAVSTIEDDWKSLIDTGKIVRDGSDQGYMTHKGKPVVAVWGIGWSQNSTDRQYSWAQCLDIVNFLKDDPNYGGFTVMIGVKDDWRSKNIGNQTMLAIVTKADIISPWTVGGYTTTDQVNSYATSKWLPDKQWCDSHSKDYLPVIWPGYSFYNASGHTKHLNQRSRRGGQLLWDQVNATINTVGTNMIYVAMFDEVDEGTAIFKVSNNPPRPGGADMFVTYDMDGYDLPSDEYLWLVGQAARALRGEISPVPSTRPSR